MGASEAARADLYTGLAEALGPSRADTLMSLLPPHDYDQLATKADLAQLKSDLDVVKSELRAELGAEIRAVGESLNARIDRLFYLLVLVMIAVLGAMVTIFFA